MIEDFVIIGGGVAGLAAANRLADLGARPLLIEGGSYPSHKVCGEFFSPECIEQVEAWGVQPKVWISRVNFHSSSTLYSLKLPRNGFTLSHIVFDPTLLEYGRAKGVRVRTGVKVNHIKDKYTLELSTGEKVKVKNLIIATGRLTKKPAMPYMGIKAHFTDIPYQDTVEMFAFPGAYVGVSPIEEGKANVACIAQADKVQAAGSAEAFMQQLYDQNRDFDALLSQGKRLFPEWLTCQVPKFGMKKTPDWENAYFVGDATSTITPVCGNGLSMAITSGVMAADSAFKGDWIGFKMAMGQRFATPLRYGVALHHVMLCPFLSQLLMKSCKLFPRLGPRLYQSTR